jgi:ribosomal protein L7/L12
MPTEQEMTQLRLRLVHLEGQVAFLYKHLGVTFVPEQSPTDDPRIIEQLKKGNLLEAIKIHRELTGAGLAEAKIAVEELKGRLGI